MLRCSRLFTSLTAVALATTLLGCEKPQETAPATTATPTVAPKPTAAPAKPTATASAEPEVKPSHPCPEGSEGDGTFKKPCDATGTARAMEVTYTGKMDDKGPQFRVINKTKLEILYGYLVVYFYDKDGKQLKVPAAEPDGKERPAKTCGGNIFAGPMKPSEKAVLTFSCVKKKHVPEGTDAIEAELRTVGFTSKDDSKKADTYWRNKDLVPDERPKGGVKK
ncbi:MAG: hypothetical protein JRI23_25470 [Deltaproteobacteria bacterium]|jgi:hypothetical protein|nr:hypothetical protein [Deltaproteobacteria bacterium]MBW2535372.1 hypothetical protein [Deltaproteobacteria bacterium]